MEDFTEDIQTTDEYEDQEAKRAEARVHKLFREVFDNNEGQEALEILSALFDTHVPSMPAAKFDTTKAAYLDGQKSVLCEIYKILAGQYTQK